MLAGVEARGLYCYLPQLLSTYFVRQATSCDVELTDWAMLAGSWARGVLLSLPPSTGIIDTLCMVFFFFFFWHECWALKPRPQQASTEPSPTLLKWPWVYIVWFLTPVSLFQETLSFLFLSLCNIIWWNVGFLMLFDLPTFMEIGKNILSTTNLGFIFLKSVFWGKPHSVAQSGLVLTRYPDWPQTHINPLASVS